MPQRLFALRDAHDNVEYVDFNTLISNPAWKEGRVFYDNQENALSYYNDTDGVTINIGQEQVVKVVNKTGAPLLNGNIVYIDGAQGNRPTAAKAVASDYDKATKTIGVITQTSIADNNAGYATTFGIVHDLDTSGLVVGANVWLDPATPGGFTTTKPTAHGQFLIRIGTVLSVSSTQGEILVYPQIFETAFGDVVAGNYSEFEADGTLVAYGTAQTWTDVYPSSVTVSANPTAGATFSEFSGNLRAIEFTGSGVNSKEVQAGFQFPHDYAEGSTIVPHLHLFIPVSGATGTIKFGCEYTWESIGSSGAVGTSTITGTLTIGQSMGPYNNRILSFGGLDGTGKGISSVFMARFFRNPADPTDTFASSVWLTSADIHYLQNTNGSRNETTK